MTNTVNTIRNARVGLLLGAFLAATTMFSAAPAAAADKDTLTIALAANFQSLDPHKTGVVGTDLSVASHVYSPLIIMNPDLKLSPALATKWETVEPTRWRFTLRPDVKFPDGKPVDATVVKWNIERILNPETKAPWANRYKLIERVEVVDPTTVDIFTSQPFPALAAQLSMFLIMSPDWTASHNPAVEAFGSGPYELVEFKAGSSIKLKARDDYWGEKPDFANVEFRVMPEAASRISGLLAGEIDVITGFATTEIERINKSGKANAGAIPSNRVNGVRFNTLKPPFAGNIDLRLALNYAVDKQGIMDGIWGPITTLSQCQVLNEGYFGFNPNLKPMPYDPAKAKELLAKAGFANGLDLTFEVPRGRYLSGEDISQVVAAQLAEVGVNLKIVEIEFSTYMERLFAKQLPELSYFGTAWPTWDADGQLTAFQPGDPSSYYDNKEFSALIDQARTEIDVEKRKELYWKATDLMCADPSGIFMFDQPLTYAQSNDVVWGVRGDDWMRAYDVKRKN
ncbi:MAG: ABC transporter substrate-binding protein [Rhizobiaceae bacterium]